MPTKSVSTHSRPKAAALQNVYYAPNMEVSTHSRPKAAAQYDAYERAVQNVSTHSRPKAAASIGLISVPMNSAFQHTAARRRLHLLHP